MDLVAMTVGISWTLTGLLCIGLSIPLVLQQVSRNRLYGFRITESLASDDAWFAINRYAGKRLIVWSIPLVLTGVVSFFLPLQSHTGLALAIGTLPIVFVLIPVIDAWRFARQYRAAR